MAVKIAFLSAGLGNVSRGFETSTASWFNEVKNSEYLEARLFSGGTYSGATKVFNYARDGALLSLFRKMKLVNDGCKAEQITFSLGLLLHLFQFKPDVIWLQEGVLADMLLRFKKLFRLKYKIVFCDGAPVGHQFADKFDYIMFLHTYAYNDAIKAGVKKEKSLVVPLVSRFPEKLIPKEEARRHFNIATDRFVIICVAAWNNHHKRINYLLHEVAKLEHGKVKLLLCGQAEKETASLKETAMQLNIDADWYTLTPSELSTAYAASDLFVLPSINEGFGIVLVEAGAHKLPVICHPHAGGKFIFGENYMGLTDLSKPDNLKNKIETLVNASLNDIGDHTSEIIFEKFSKEKLSKQFIDFVVQASKGENVNC